MTEANPGRGGARAAASRQGYLKALASGFTPEQIAEASHASVRTIRREIDRALDERRLDAPERYVHLQVARLTKALRLADYHIERGDLAAVGPLATPRRRARPLSRASRSLPAGGQRAACLSGPSPTASGAHPHFRPFAKAIAISRQPERGDQPVRAPD